jgi:hypothetical protein
LNDGRSDIAHGLNVKPVNDHAQPAHHQYQQLQATKPAVIENLTYVDRIHDWLHQALFVVVID